MHCHDDSIMQNILDTVTQVIVTKLMDYQHFKDTLVKHVMQAGVLDRIKQEEEEEEEEMFLFDPSYISHNTNICPC